MVRSLIVFHNKRVVAIEFGHIIVASTNIFASRFTNSRVEFNRRQTNLVAHALAGATTLSTSSTTYFEMTSCIDTLVINEMI